MKIYRVIIILALVALCGIGWMLYINNTVTSDKTYHQYVSNGDRRRDEGLYQLAIESYKAADEIKPSENLCGTIISTYEEWYASEPVRDVQKGLEKAYGDAIVNYPQNIVFWEGYVKECVDSERFTEAVSLYDRASVKGLHSDNLTQLYKQAYYAVKLTNSTYPVITLGALDSVYTYSDGGEQYGTLKANGNEGISYSSFLYISPAGPGGTVLVKDENGECFAIDTTGKKLARFMLNISECRGPGGKLLAARTSESDEWRFFDYEGKEQFGGYLNAGGFAYGKAPVQLSDGSWTFVDEDGQTIEERFDDIRLDESGNYLMNNCLFVKRSGEWILKNLDEKEVNVFTCDDIDVSRGEAIAFCKDGLWGFVSKKGEVIIPPTYEHAKSFSGGVAAVCVDGLWGFIDPQGEMVIEPVYKDAGYFDSKGGTCPVMVQEKDVWQLLTWRVTR